LTYIDDLQLDNSAIISQSCSVREQVLYTLFSTAPRVPGDIARRLSGGD